MIKHLRRILRNNKYIRKFLINSKNEKLHKLGIQARNNCFCEHVEKGIANKIVLHGPFTGLKYSTFKTRWEKSYNKIFGTYENELNGVWEQIANEQYKIIIDVGCSEGYYACGMALRYPDATVYAYDINETARKECAEMSQLNNIKNIEIREYCSPETIKMFNWNHNKGLIICDCEGYERDLFNEDNVKNLKNIDLVIEVHDFEGEKHSEDSIYTYLVQLFKGTHEIKTIETLTPCEKIKQYKFDDINYLTLEEKIWVVNEGRPKKMEWLWLKAKKKIEIVSN